MKASTGKRVLMLLENAIYPTDSRVRPEATSLVAAGYQVSVICPGLITERWWETVTGVQVYRFPMLIQGDSFLGYLWEYGYSLVATFILSWLVFFRLGFDVIHTHNPPDFLFLIVSIYKVLGKRFIYDQHDLVPEMYEVRFKGRNRQVYQLMVWAEILSCRLADRVIVANQSHKRMIMQRSGIPEEHITVVRNGPILNHLGPIEPDPELRQEGKMTICYVGVMGHQDGVDYLMRALQHLVVKLRRTDFFCVLVGAGNAWRSMKSLSEQLNLTDYVWFTGWVDPTEVGSYLSAADICVAPEPSNAYNDQCTVIKMAEYMAAGKPVVAFDLPEHRVTARGAAVYARPNEELDFARQIAWLMGDPRRREEMGEIGRQRVEKELAWVHQEKHLLAAYEALTCSLKSDQSIGSGDIH